MWKSKDLISNGIKFFNQIKTKLESFGIKSYIIKKNQENIRKDEIKTKSMDLELRI